MSEMEGGSRENAEILKSDQASTHPCADFLEGRKQVSEIFAEILESRLFHANSSFS